MADCIRDHLPDGLDRQLIVILTGDAFDAGAEVDVLQHEVVGILDLLIDRTGKFFTGNENIPDSPLEYRALDGGIGELSRVAVQQQIPVGGMVSSVALHQQLP